MRFVSDGLDLVRGHRISPADNPSRQACIAVFVFEYQICAGRSLKNNTGCSLVGHHEQCCFLFYEWASTRMTSSVEDILILIPAPVFALTLPARFALYDLYAVHRDR